MLLKRLQALLLTFVVGRLLSLQPVLEVTARHASKKSGGSSKNLGGKSPGRRYGYKKLDGKASLLHSKYEGCDLS